MQQKRTKRSRMRGAENTRGHGSKKKHRGAGSRGGVGKAGSGKRGDHKLMKSTNYKNAGYLGRNGFTSQKTPDTIVTIDYLERSIVSLVAEGKASVSKDIYTIDIKVLGANKLLSKGTLTKKLNITAEKATKRATQKVEAIGGKVILPVAGDEVEEVVADEVVEKQVKEKVKPTKK